MTGAVHRAIPYPESYTSLKFLQSPIAKTKAYYSIPKATRMARTGLGWAAWEIPYVAGRLAYHNLIGRKAAGKSGAQYGKQLGENNPFLAIRARQMGQA